LWQVAQFPPAGRTELVFASGISFGVEKSAHDADSDVVSLDEEEATRVRAEEQIRLHGNYFEITILNLGAEGSIGLGLARASYPTTDLMPGWQSGSYVLCILIVTFVCVTCIFAPYVRISSNLVVCY
jgi:hypothetical protein